MALSTSLITALTVLISGVLFFFYCGFVFYIGADTFILPAETKKQATAACFLAASVYLTLLICVYLKKWHPERIPRFLRWRVLRQRARERFASLTGAPRGIPLGSPPGGGSGRQQLELRPLVNPPTRGRW